MDLDVYNILGVPQSATTEEVKKAYRKKALKCHPDKNPDNPEAAKLFHQLTKALELLLDTAARAAYDRVLNVKQAAKLRTEALDSKRKKLKEELEARENEANLRASGHKIYSFKTDEEKLQAEIKRLREEGSKQLEEEMEFVRQQVQMEVANREAEEESNPSKYRLKIKWHVDKDDHQNGGYDYEKLLKIFSKYGDISVLVVSPKKKGSALLEFSSKEPALKAEQFEKGFPKNPLKVSWLEKNLISASTTNNHSKNISFEKLSTDSTTSGISFEKPSKLTSNSHSLFPSMSNPSTLSSNTHSLFPSMSNPSTLSSNTRSLFPSMSNKLNKNTFPVFPFAPNKNSEVKSAESSTTLNSDYDYETQVLMQLQEAEKRKRETESLLKEDIS